jgi:hypothetical protein
MRRRNLEALVRVSVRHGVAPSFDSAALTMTAAAARKDRLFDYAPIVLSCHAHAWATMVSMSV